MGVGGDLSDIAPGLVPVRAHGGLNASETALCIRHQIHLIAYSE